MGREHFSIPIEKTGVEKKIHIMSFNWLITPTLLFSYLLFWAGYRLAGSLKSARLILTVSLIAGLSAIPAALFILYYSHLFDNWRAFYAFRSITGIELTAAGAGFTAGIIAHWGVKTRFMSISGTILLLTSGIILPYVKPLLAPAETNKFTDSWDGVVCKQSSGYSCGAACTATILQHYGFTTTECEIAKECFTSRRGTENWYIARAIRNRGLNAHFLTKMPNEGIPAPCIAGVTLGRVGHFITILEDLGDSYRTGDPLVGERVFSKASITNRYHFTGFFITVESKNTP
ncbi:MAG: cysteine peptidase family C39 domain-containing protein [Pontiellaceae bacterium]|jgi:hypothetical protein|nr:cysteine peptidase family C39 domain-containing protein [Pontiellaceae bacterium]